MNPLLRIAGLWRGQAGWLAFGALLSLGALAAGAALMGFSGRTIALSMLGGALLVPAMLQYTGIARVVLRYLERVFSHEATFRALAHLRIWLFTGLARSAAGGLGLRRAGDVLARLVNDVDALDGLFLRIFVPLLGALLLLPILAVLLWHVHPWAVIVLLPFGYVAFYLPVLAARAASANSRQAGLAMSGLRSAALDALSGLREVKIFAAEGRMLATVQAREAGLLAAQRELASRNSALNAVAFIAAQSGILLAILIGLAGHAVAAALDLATSQVRSSFSTASRASSRVSSSEGSRRTQLSPPPAISSFSSRARLMNSRLLEFSFRPIKRPLPRMSSTTSGKRSFRPDSCWAK